MHVMTGKDLKSKSLSMEVISLNSKDLHSCLELDAIALKGLWSKEQWERELSDSGRLCLGIFDSSKLIAFGCGWIVVDEFHLTAVAVHPKHRRRGLAHLVLSNLFIQALKGGCALVTLEVKSDDDAALGLYKSCGFKTAGIRSNYYKNGTDALIQWRSISL